jgi:hypothetical protein
MIKKHLKIQGSSWTQAPSSHVMIPFAGSGWECDWNGDIVMELSETAGQWVLCESEL